MNAQSDRSWWSRNRKWVLLGFVGFVLLSAGGVAAITSIMKSSGGYAEAVQLAKTDCLVQEALGKPIEPGWFVSGTVNVSGASGNSELSVPLKGSRRAGRLYIVAEKVAGNWEYDMLQLNVDGRSDNIDLLSEPRRKCDA